MKKIGTRIEVMNGGAKQTRGGYTKKTLRYTKGGNIIPVRLVVEGGFLTKRLKKAALKGITKLQQNPKLAELQKKGQALLEKNKEEINKHIINGQALLKKQTTSLNKGGLTTHMNNLHTHVTMLHKGMAKINPTNSTASSDEFKKSINKHINNIDAHINKLHNDPRVQQLQSHPMVKQLQNHPMVKKMKNHALLSKFKNHLK